MPPDELRLRMSEAAINNSSPEIFAARRRNRRPIAEEASRDSRASLRAPSSAFKRSHSGILGADNWPRNKPLRARPFQRDNPRKKRSRLSTCSRPASTSDSRPNECAAPPIGNALSASCCSFSSESIMRRGSARCRERIDGGGFVPTEFGIEQHQRTRCDSRLALAGGWPRISAVARLGARGDVSGIRDQVIVSPAAAV